MSISSMLPDMRTIQKPSVSVEPRSVSVKQDETVSIRCRVTSGAPPVQLEWKRANNQPLADNVKVGPDGSVLTITLARPGNQGQYRCIATNAQGKSTVTATLTVKPPQDGGTFVCRAQNKDGTSEVKVELKVEGGAIEPKATVHQTDMMAVEGQTVTMHCQASGSPTPVITWSKLRAPLPWQHKAEGGTLTLSNVGRQDSGQYICNATNSAGFSEAYVQMEVDTPPYATTVPDHVTARRGQSMRVQCIAHGSHPISFHWSRVGGAAMSSGAKITKEGMLTIAQLKPSDSGTYKCVATNHIGNSETFATVAVRGHSLSRTDGTRLSDPYTLTRWMDDVTGCPLVE
ncbi:hypothetical protein QTP70_006836 [Hemibagrus guttatus]|uniref:Ig-like domain-containing protein n=1 Tax=Hemibagrus guttatus TaxID=175788 RepID=A0AAE0PYB6_9TELE|nr:hypothetical protein QTP70_006836 [Hemibagrus guttatus]